MQRLTIDELSRQTGVSSRNIRAWQSKGLLPAPSLEGRTGFYDEGHLARVKFIEKFQDRGYSLAAIADLLNAWEVGQDLGSLLGLEEALTLNWTDEEAKHLSLDELKQLFPGLRLEPGLMERAEETNLFSKHGESVLIPSPRLLRLAQVAFEAGMSFEEILNILEEIQKDLGNLAQKVVSSFVSGLWEPLKAAGQPPEGLMKLGEGIQNLREVSPGAIAGILSRAIEKEITSAAIRDIQLRVKPNP